MLKQLIREKIKRVGVFIHSGIGLGGGIVVLWIILGYVSPKIINMVKKIFLRWGNQFLQVLTSPPSFKEIFFFSLVVSLVGGILAIFIYEVTKKVVLGRETYLRIGAFLAIIGWVFFFALPVLWFASSVWEFIKQREIAELFSKKLISFLLQTFLFFLIIGMWVGHRFEKKGISGKQNA